MKLIKLNTDHYVIVTDSEIKDGDWMIRNGEQPTLVTPNFWWDFGVPYKKITHSTQPNKGMENVTFISPKEIKELLGEVDVENKAELYIWGGVYLTEQEKQQTEIAYMTGYNQALEDNKDKRFSEEDILNILYDYDNVDWSKREHKQSFIMMREWFSEKLQSLQPKTEWEVEFVDGKLKLK